MNAAALYLENGHLFEGIGFGASVTGGGEVVFNTGMTGYQEIFTDPSYLGQIIVMGSPHLGNTGVNLEDVESRKLFLSGVVTREYCTVPSSWRSKQTLDQYLSEAGVPGISNVDTRQITQILRDEGAQRACIFPFQKGSRSIVEEGKKLISKVPPMEGRELVSEVSCTSPYEFKEGDLGETKGTIVVYDFGVKSNTLRYLRRNHLQVWVVPYQTPAKDVLNLKPLAVLLSNGPGDPGIVSGAVEEIKSLISSVPIFAICMGHQVLARALGCSTYKLKFGHHGINHPVKDLKTGRILITSQNHGFAVKAQDIEKVKDVKLSHINLNDQTVEGYYSEKRRFLSVQFHPEAAPGPSDATYLFNYFIRGFIQ